MKKILLLGTGGTIASKQTEDGLQPALTAPEILEYVPGVERYCDIEAGVQHRLHQYVSGDLVSDRPCH